jgi:hypothetical protein
MAANATITPKTRARWPLTAFAIAGGLCLSGTTLCAEQPLSAIDWLSQSIAPTAQPATSVPIVPAKPAEPPVAAQGTTLPAAVTVSVLGQINIDKTGILPPSVTGFPRALWGNGRSADVIAAFSGLQLERLPALQSLLITLLLAEADPPFDAAPPGAMLTARIDRLLALGALDQAQALLDAAGPLHDPELFRRLFDVALLTDQATRACQELLANPGLSPALVTRVFCQARMGDVSNATLTLATAKALDQISGGEAELLARFLDPELSEIEGPILTPPPSPMTPLAWRIYEAVGEPLPTSNLALAFAHAELDERTAWRAQVEAAERLVRAGVLAPNHLLGLYTERQPAASGGVWDRIAAFQRLDQTVQSGDPVAVGSALAKAYEMMKAAELETMLAAIYAKPLSRLDLTPSDRRIAFELALLSPDFESLAQGDPGEIRPDTAFLQGLAKGDLKGTTPPGSLGRAIAPAFDAPVLTPHFKTLKAEGRIGEIILSAMKMVMEGGFGDLRQITDGLSALRLVGLESIARRTALELMLIEMRG